jgi:hypothetical protein
LARLVWSGGQALLILTVAFFTFQVAQSWADKGISHLRWFFPVAITISVCSVLGLGLVVLNAKQHFWTKTEDLSLAEKLAIDLVDYAKQLHSDSRDHPLVNLRNNSSLMLHILGFHELRTQLGELALKSAVVIGDNATRSEVLIDDLGWGHYCLGNTDSAVENIRRGVQVAKEAKSHKSGTELLRLSLCEAKGLRHLALISYQERADSVVPLLDEALEILVALDQSIIDVTRDVAQIYHAKALVLAMRLGVHKTGMMRKEDIQGIQMINEALAQLRQASSIFSSIEDTERYAKSLALEVRLLEAKQSETEAKEVAALFERTLASSHWVRVEGIKTLTGV